MGESMKGVKKARYVTDEEEAELVLVDEVLEKLRIGITNNGHFICVPDSTRETQYIKFGYVKTLAIHEYLKHPKAKFGRNKISKILSAHLPNATMRDPTQATEVTVVGILQS